MQTESVEFWETVNRVSLGPHPPRVKRRHIYGYSGHTASQLLVTAVSGVLIGLCGVTLQTGIEYLVWLRNLALQPLFDASLGQAVGASVAAAVVAVGAASLCVLRFAPRAAGAGVAAVMAALNGCAIPQLLTGGVLVVKYLGTVLARVACLALGPEGPMVHLGACIASLVYTSEHRFGRWAGGHWWRWRQPQATDGGSRGGGYTPLPDGPGARAVGGEPLSLPPPPAQHRWLFNAQDHREVCSAGAGAGLAAAFGAPIGGVLFSLEEASTHWSRKTTWRCFLCTIAATFTLAQTHPRAATGMLSLRGLYSLSNQQWAWQMPLIVLASACGGLLGAAFNLLRIRLKKAGHRGAACSTLAWAGVVAAATALAATLLPAALGRCLETPHEWDVADVVRHNCPEGQYNDLGTALLSDAVWVIKSLLQLGSDAEPINNGLCSLSVPCYYSARTLAVFCAAYLLLMVAASSTNVPGGLLCTGAGAGSGQARRADRASVRCMPAWPCPPSA